MNVETSTSNSTPARPPTMIVDVTTGVPTAAIATGVELVNVLVCLMPKGNAGGAAARAPETNAIHVIAANTTPTPARKASRPDGETVVGRRFMLLLCHIGSDPCLVASPGRAATRASMIAVAGSALRICSVVADIRWHQLWCVSPVVPG